MMHTEVLKGRLVKLVLFFFGMLHAREHETFEQSLWRIHKQILAGARGLRFVSRHADTSWWEETLGERWQIGYIAVRLSPKAK